MKLYMRIEIKICGLTCARDARAALDAGADYLGFVLYSRSVRGITATRLRQIVERLTSHPKCIGVFINESPGRVLQIARDCGLFAVQLHGEEPAADFARWPTPIWRAVRIRNRHFYPAPRYWPADRYVVDAAVTGAYGGTGITADWIAARRLARRRPIMLAGGLTPENVAAAIRRVQPQGVDVAGGVEKTPGKKDWRKIQAFIRAARSAWVN